MTALNSKNSLDGIEFHTSHFTRLDESPDDIFYRSARLVTHIDVGARTALTAHYAEQLQDGDTILDLMSSCVSHLPAEVSLKTVVGVGMNAHELQTNPHLDDYFVQNLNENSSLPFKSCTFEACLIAVSVQYLTDPVTVFAEIGRTLSPGGRLIVSFSNRMFPTKAVSIWRSLDHVGRCEYVAACMERSAVYTNIKAVDLTPHVERSDPLYSVTAFKPDKIKGSRDQRSNV